MHHRLRFLVDLLQRRLPSRQHGLPGRDPPRRKVIVKARPVERRNGWRLRPRSFAITGPNWYGRVGLRNGPG
jgi:hypothetical protein